MNPADAISGLRPPAVPLVACDPYFSVWSQHDRLTDGPTTHWTGKPHRMASLVRVDGKAFRLMGDKPGNVEAMEQTNLLVWPTRTVYTFEDAGVRLTLTFMTPLLPDDLDVASRPVTYVTWAAESTDGSEHDVSVYFDAAADFAVNEPRQEVEWQREAVGDLTALRVGTITQPVLEKRGDDLRIDWGHFYVAADTDDAKAAFVPQVDGREAFVDGKKLPDGDAASEPLSVEDGAPVLALSFDLGKVGQEAVKRHAILAYDDQYSIQYFRTKLRPYWRKDGAEAADLLKTAAAEYEQLAERCEAFDEEVVTDLAKIGGESYAKIGVLSYRQSLAAQKICADANGMPIMMSKENNSNGCIATVDVLYPAAPQMLVFAPSMLKASMQPLLAYSSSELWPHDSAPHDLGTYPMATGQVYGGMSSPMPVEESGNMLVLMAALATVEGNADFADAYWPTLTEWYNYLVDHGLDPENQLCTDDFAGHLARNANLSAKAIMGIAGYGRLCEMTGRTAEAEKAFATARDYARKWMELGGDGDHYVLAFGQDGTWSQKYNFVWDKLLDFNVVPDEVIETEWAYYRGKINQYGLPLDSRKNYTKLDWEMWTATMAPRQEDFQLLVDTLAKWANETSTRVPLTDWYDTLDGRQTGFKARSVVGGNFIGLMKDREIWRKYASRDKGITGEWAPLKTEMPEMTGYAATADRKGKAPTWHYTFNRPSGDWYSREYSATGDWREGKAGFGTEGTPSAIVGTPWDTSDIYLRRTFTLPEGAELKDPHLWLAHDEDIEVYINGVLALRRESFANNYQEYRIAPDAAATLTPGENTIAVHCHQTTGGQYVDVGVVDLIESETVVDQE